MTTSKLAESGTAPTVVRERPGGVADGRLDATPSRVFSFDELKEAHRIMEAGEAGGKMVVVLE